MWGEINNWLPWFSEQSSLHDEDLLSELEILDDIEDEVAVRDGKVTEFQADYGLIDGEYYFPRTMQPKICLKPLRVGDQVSYRASRKDANHQWKVEELLSSSSSLHTDYWDDGGDAEQTTTTVNQDDDKTRSRDVAKVVKVVDNGRQVHAEVEGENGAEVLRFNALSYYLNFIPTPGDFLTLDLLLDGFTLDDLKGAKVVGVAPLRTQVIEDAVVSSWWSQSRKGVVDGNIFFGSNACTHSYIPKVKDTVRVHAIECETSDANRKCSWRATRVIPRGAVDVSRLRPMLSQHLENPTQSRLLEEMMRDKCCVHIDDDLNFGVLPIGRVIKQTIVISSDNDKDVVLKSVLFRGSGRKDSTVLKLRDPQCLPLVIEPHSRPTVIVCCEGVNFGHTKILTVFTFSNGDEEELFQIGAHISMEVRDPMLEQIQSNLKPNLARFDHSYGAPFSRKDGSVVVPGQRKKYQQGMKFTKTRLAEYPIPRHLETIVLERDSSELLDQYPYLGEELCMANYKDKFSNLLHLEEIEQAQQMLRYTLIEVPFEVRGEYLSLQVPGLAEKRPSLVIGDSAIASLSGVPNAQLYEGCIREVRSHSVLLGFDQRFHQRYCGEVYDLQFRFSRGPFKKMHQAIDEVVKNFGEQVLFPSHVQALPPQVSFVVETGKRIIYKKYPVEKQHYGLGRRKVDLNNTSISSVDSSSTCSNSTTKKKRRSVVETLFADKMVPLDYGSEFVTPKVPPLGSTRTTKFLPSNKPLDFEFKLSNEGNRNRSNNNNVTKKKVTPYIPKEMLVAKKMTADGQLILSWVNSNLNLEQQNAVIRILSGHARPLPYIIYGPPGTGKTVTVVEAILQIFALRSDSRILVVTPSNSSADLIVERLHASGKLSIGEMARLNAYQRGVDVIPEAVRPYSFPNDTMEILSKVVRHRIVVATCSTSGGLYKLGLSEGHFTHCFIDEAGETTEPESMIPIGLLATSNKSQIILAGDPKQLGPVLQSASSKFYGLELSFLERLSWMPLYDRDDSRFGDHGNYDPMLVTKLLRNYRSHADILKVSSELFYDAELIPKAPSEITQAFVGKTFLPNPDHPLIFHGVRGQNYQEGDSPSWFNPAEALQATFYFKQLMNLGVRPEDVGIIAPYRQQSAKLRDIFKSLDLPLPRIGSVEEFQGQERPVIIVTTVRSMGHQLEVIGDSRRGLGFLQSEKRFNVAITRAMSLLIIVGDPHLLGGDPSWLVFLQHCIQLGAYTGCDLPIGLTVDDDDCVI